LIIVLQDGEEFRTLSDFEELPIAIRTYGTYYSELCHGKSHRELQESYGLSLNFFVASKSHP
jgi:hypothetical protein